MKTTKPCHCCDGTGRELDPVVLGGQMRELRTKVGLSLRSMSELLHISAPYLCDLELGRRNWSVPLIEDYKRLCK